MSYTNVDRIGDRIIRKLHSPDRTQTFMYLLLQLDGDNIIDRQEFTTLSAARVAAGFVGLQQSKLTAPKSSYEQNRKGYRAGSNMSKGKK